MTAQRLGAAATARPTTTSGRLLLAAGLTFHSGRRLADHPDLVAAIEAEAREQAEAALAEAVALLDDEPWLRLVALALRAPSLDPDAAWQVLQKALRNRLAAHAEQGENAHEAGIRRARADLAARLGFDAEQGEGTK